LTVAVNFEGGGKTVAAVNLGKGGKGKTDLSLAKTGGEKRREKKKRKTLF